MDNKLVTVMFTRDTVLEVEGADFKAGECVELNEASAHRWLKRNAAVVAPRSQAKAEAQAEVKEIEAKVQADFDAEADRKAKQASTKK